MFDLGQIFYLISAHFYFISDIETVLWLCNDNNSEMHNYKLCMFRETVLLTFSPSVFRRDILRELKPHGAVPAVYNMF